MNEWQIQVANGAGKHCRRRALYNMRFTTWHIPVQTLFRSHASQNVPETVESKLSFDTTVYFTTWVRRKSAVSERFSLDVPLWTPPRFRFLRRRSSSLLWLRPGLHQISHRLRKKRRNKAPNITPPTCTRCSSGVLWLEQLRALSVWRHKHQMPLWNAGSVE